MNETYESYTHAHRRNWAWTILLASSIIWGTIPLVSAISEGSNDPFMFSAAFGFGGSVSGLLYLFIFHPEVLKWNKIRTFLPDRTTFFKKLEEPTGNDPPRWNWLIIAIMPRITVAFYAWATAYIPELVAAVLLELWPIFSVLLLTKLFSKGQRFKFSPRNTVLLVVIFLGVALVILSGNQYGFRNLLDIDIDTVIGVSLMVITAASTGMGVYFYKWADVKRTESPKPEAMPSISKLESTEHKKVGYFMFLTTVSTFISGIIGLVISLFTSNSLGWNNFWIAFSAALIVATLGGLTNAYGVLKSIDNAGILAIRFLTPVFAVIYLWGFSYVDSVRLDIFVLGLFAIVSGNMLFKRTPKTKKYDITSAE